MNHQQQNNSPTLKIQKQYHNRRMKIPRQKIPNLSTGDKFDHPNIVFFRKISNSFKLLEQPVQTRTKLSQLGLVEAGRRLAAKNQLSPRLKELSEVKKMKQSLNLQLSQKDNKNDKTRLASTLHGIWGGQKTQKKQRILPKSSSLPPKEEIKINNSITGTNIGLLPLEHILAVRQKRQQQQLLEILNKTKVSPEEDQEDEQKQQRKHSENEDLAPIKDDYLKWADKIIKGQDKVYDYYDRNLMDKVKLYKRKQFKMNHKSMWK